MKAECHLDIWSYSKLIKWQQQWQQLLEVMQAVDQVVRAQLPQPQQGLDLTFVIG
jgi:hypothetical protein